MTKFSEVFILVAPSAFIQLKSTKGAMLPGGSINMLDDAEGNGFLLWRNHFSHVVLARIRILSWQSAFILGSDTIRFSVGENKFPPQLEVFKGSNHRNHPLSGFRKSFSIHSNINRFLLTELCFKRRQVWKIKRI